MIYEPSTIIENREYGPGHWVVRIQVERELPEIRAGQFANLRCDPHDSFSVMRPFSILDLDMATGRMDIYYKHLGRLSTALSDFAPGTKLDVLYPLGSYFPWHPEWRRVALVGGGVGIAPLLLMARQLEPHGSTMQVDLYFGGNTEADLVPELLDEYGYPVHKSTMDGSAGHKGTVVDLFAQAEDYYDVVYTCGPNPMMQALQEVVEKGTPAYASLEEYMACAVGACLGCTAQVRDSEGRLRNQTVCKTGPVFELHNVVFH